MYVFTSSTLALTYLENQDAQARRKKQILILTYILSKDAATLQSTPGVKSIRAIRKFQRPKYMSRQDTTISDRVTLRMLDLRVVSDINDTELPPDSQAIHIMTVCITFLAPHQ
jgi:hypothetical protein